MASITDTVAALRAEGDDLERMVADLPSERWQTSTPAKGWTVAHQIGHLLWTDEAALLTLRKDPAFDDLLQRAQTSSTLVDDAADELAQVPPSELRERWAGSRERLAAALVDHPEDQPIRWFGPPMRTRALATARLMETWAHGLDVADALGVVREPTPRLRDVAHIGVRTRDFSFAINGLPAPQEEFRIELAAPGEGTWAWGPEDAAQRVTGSAEAFCQVVTQRRDLTQVDLVAVGSAAQTWLGIAQAFAGPPKRSTSPTQSTTGAR